MCSWLPIKSHSSSPSSKLSRLTFGARKTNSFSPWEIVSVSLNSLILIDQKDDDFPHFNFASAKWINSCKLSYRCTREIYSVISEFFYRYWKTTAFADLRLCVVKFREGSKIIWCRLVKLRIVAEVCRYFLNLLGHIVGPAFS